MFLNHNFKINSFAQRNADNLALVILMVSLSIQQKWSTVGHMLSSVKESKKDSIYLWGSKAATYDYISTHKHFMYGQMMAALNSHYPNDLKAFSLMKIFLKIDGLGIAKAGFVCQLISGLVGCMDVHNIKIYGVDPKLLVLNKNLTSKRGIENNEKKIKQYIKLCHDYGTENLWNSWCSMIADKYPKDFVDAHHVSELHYTYLTGDYNVSERTI